MHFVADLTLVLLAAVMGGYLAQHRTAADCRLHPRRPCRRPISGRRLDEVRIRTRLGASVVGIIRSGSLLANPDGEATLEAGDLVAVLGRREQIARFHEALHDHSHNSV
jgi:K+/H+ antiporter YhaU regulatory subunit KhtT